MGADRIHEDVERSLLEETSDLIREIREDIFRCGTLSIHTQHARDDLLRRIDAFLITSSETPQPVTDRLSALVFPSKFKLPNGTVEGLGITKRELFAAMALQGLCANETEQLSYTPTQMIFEAVKYADTLLKELAK